jgi:hypothetical protein
MFRKHLSHILILTFLFIQGVGFAQQATKPGFVEGMWLPNQLAEKNAEEMKAAGLELSLEEVYNPDGTSLENGIVVLSGGSCTAEAISDQGLLLTNHHCAYDAVVEISSTDFNPLDDGYWAKSYDEELPLEGVTAGFIMEIKDVSDTVLSVEGEERAALIEALETAASEGNGLTAQVKEMYHGLEYHLFVHQVYEDVRLVGIPPQDIGKFGYDTDNWVWPRHTGDFAMLRVYADENNEPAEYSEDNKPYHPKHFFPLSLNGIDKDDYTMIMGYPGTTTRYLTSYEVDYRLDQQYPDQIKLLGITTGEMKKAMDKDEATRLKLSGKYSGLMNYYKYLQGASTMLKRNDIPEVKAKEQKAFTDWINEEPARQEEYGEVLPTIEELHKSFGKADHLWQYIIFTLLHPDNASVAMRTSFMNLRQLNATMQRGTEADVEELIGAMEEELKDTYEDFIPEVDKAVFLKHFRALYEDFDEDMRISTFADILDGKEAFDPYLGLSPKVAKKMKKKGKVKKRKKMWDAMSDLEKIMAWADTAYDRSLAVSLDNLEGFLKAPNQEVLAEDPLLNLTQNMVITYSMKAAMALNTFNAQIEELKRLWLKGLMEMQPERTFYPDANSSLRLSYGKVRPYSVGDTLDYNYFTTTEGIMEKYDPNNPDYQVPEKLRQLINDKDYGKYLDDNGKMWVCFLTTNDITGGNSGSPVLNAKGELIGTAFDGNWESMCGDIEVLPSVNRTIVADIRYILFIVDKFGEAQRILDEVDIVE